MRTAVPTLLLALQICARAADPQAFTMYLCVDSMLQLKEQGLAPPKLVYGYINGRKTECMLEREFRLRYCATEAEKAIASKPDSQAMLEQRGMRRPVKSKPLIEMVYKGKKDLSGANLQGCDLRAIDLSGADLRNANLVAADLRNANLRGANMTGANLESAYLKGADLRDANLKGVILRNTYLQHADLRGAQDLSIENVRFARTLYRATLDDDLLEVVREYCPNRLTDPGWHWETTGLTKNSLEEAQPAGLDPKKFR